MSDFSSIYYHVLGVTCSVGTPLENHVSLEILVQTPLEKQVRPRGQIASQWRSLLNMLII